MRADDTTQDAVAQPTPAPQAVPLTAEQLDQLLSPIALYPDPLIAVILPAATYPADVVLAARFLQDGGKAEAIDAQPWDDSVKALARYPEVLKWMDQNLVWTRQVGTAFAQQPADVLTCTQRLRVAARAAGNLKDSPEQKVIVERETIRIVPANPEIIYVPVYEPSWVYGYRSVNFYHPGPLIRFSSGYRTGHWLAYHCDWNRWNVVVINRPYRVTVWREYPRWHCPSPAVAHIHHDWRPDPVRHRVALRPAQHNPSRPAANSTTLGGGSRNQIVATPGSVAAAPTITRPATAAAAPATAPASAAAVVTPPSGQRRGQIARAADTASAPNRVQITQEVQRPGNRPVVAPSSPRPVVASTAAPATPPSRIQFPSTGSSSGSTTSASRPRPPITLGAASAAAPARQNSETMGAPRRPAELRPSASSVAPAASGGAPAAGASVQALPRSRGQSWNSGAAESFPARSATAPSETESSGYPRRR